MDKVQEILNLEPRPSDMPAHNGWLASAKLRLQDHFDTKAGTIPVHNRAVKLAVVK
jgi:hypothetical protein